MKAKEILIFCVFLFALSSHCSVVITEAKKADITQIFSC